MKMILTDNSEIRVTMLTQMTAAAAAMDTVL